MKELIKQVQKLAEKEYNRASKLHGNAFHSPHEALGALMEEKCEAGFEHECLEKSVDAFLNCVMKNVNTDVVLEDIEKYATLAACELIQVAAMARKARVR